MDSTHCEEKSVVAERFIRTLKNKIYKYMTSVSKNIYIDKLDDIVNEYNNTYHRTAKMKPVDVKSGNYIEYNVNSNDKDPKFQVGDHVTISKYKNIFSKGYIPDWSEEVFAIKKSQKILCHEHMLFMTLIVKKLLEHFMKKNYKKTNQKEFMIEKVFKKKRNMLYVKWEGYDNSFNSWIDKKDLI